MGRKWLILFQSLLIITAMSGILTLLALSGHILLFINLPLIITEGYYISWWIIAVLILAPTISTIMQLVLSRTREFDADIDAAMITNDPMGLVQALAKLEYKNPGWLMGILRPGKKTDLPSILRTHPRTKDRIERLISLAEDIKGHEHDHPESGYPVLPVSTPALRPRASRGLRGIRYFE